MNKHTGEIAVAYHDPRTLTPNPRNSKLHDPIQIAAIRASIREFGFRAPILVEPDLTIVAGHARTEAAIMEDLESVPTIVMDGLTDDQIRAYIIADNRLTEIGSSWDNEMLVSELTGLAEAGFDPSVTGFSSDLWESVEPITFPDLAEGNKTSLRVLTFHMPDDEAERVLEIINRVAKENGYTADDDPRPSSGRALFDIVLAHEIGALPDGSD